MTRERHLLRHYFFQTNEGGVVVASKQIFLIRLKVLLQILTIFKGT